MYRNEINSLAVDIPMVPREQLTPPNLHAAGWGIGVAYDSSEVSVSSQEGSGGEESTSGNRISTEAHAPKGFGSLFSIPDESLNATIGPLSDYLNSSDGNFLFFSINLV